MVNLKINGRDVSVKEGTTILDAAKSIGETIPTLCYLKDINEIWCVQSLCCRRLRVQNAVLQPVIISLRRAW